MSKPVFEDLLTFSGRRDRKSFLMFFAVLFCFGVFLGMVILLIGHVALPPGMGRGIVLAGYGISAVLTLTLAAQRCRDIGITGWAALALVIPYAGWLALVAIALWPGQDGDNRFGPDPRQVGA